MAGQTTSSGIQVHRVPASHGWYWLKRGFGLLGRAPLPLLLLMLMLITASNLFGILGILGLVLAKLVVPVLLVGSPGTSVRLVTVRVHAPGSSLLLTGSPERGLCINGSSGLPGPGVPAHPKMSWRRYSA